MARYIIGRTLWAIPVLIAISIITFALMHAVPGGPFDRQKQLPPRILENVNEKYNLDDPFWKQYGDYMWGLVSRFDLGPSFRSTTLTVNDIIRDRLPVSAQLGGMALAVALAVGVPLGVVSALRHNTVVDYSSMFVAVLGVSIPSLALGPFLMWLFGLKLDVLPIATWGGPSHWVLPTLTLAAASTALIARLTRASLLQVINEDYIRTARAKGLAEYRVVVGHALKNALIPVLTISGPLFANLVTGTLIVEKIFAVPGMGRTFVDSVAARDYPVIMGTVLLFAVIIIVANLVVDVAYAFVDPRIKYRSGG
jgi:ABC-type dipeptide/oligopeptide/nickel transport system permease component